MLSNIPRTDVLLYLTDTMADWEYGHAVAEINRAGATFRVVPVAASPEPVTTMGGLQILPATTLDQIDPARVAMLILPGADTWFEGHEPVLELARTLVEAGVPVAAICGATFALARTGLLDERDHTSNDPSFLAQSGYAGGERYRLEPAVDGEGVITASALHPVEFAATIFDRLELWTPAWRAAWRGLYTTGDPAYFFQLMEAEQA